MATGSSPSLSTFLLSIFLPLSTPPLYTCQIGLVRRERENTRLKKKDKKGWDEYYSLNRKERERGGKKEDKEGGGRVRNGNT